MVNIGNDWDEILKEEFQKEYYKKIREFLKGAYSHKKIFPSMHDIFNALKYTGYRDTKVVLLGQDPYHGDGQAHGLSFSVKPGIPVPPSLQNIYRELQTDLGLRIPNNGYLKKWADQGVLLLNASLTVEAYRANSHQDIGWQILTDEIIRKLNEREEPVIFLLWGGNAKRKEGLITNPQHYILKAAHPSPLSAYNGFFGCKHFSKTNEILRSLGKDPIDWQIEDIE